MIFHQRFYFFSQICLPLIRREKPLEAGPARDEDAPSYGAPWGWSVSASAYGHGHHTGGSVAPKSPEGPPPPPRSMAPMPPPGMPPPPMHPPAGLMPSMRYVAPMEYHMPCSGPSVASPMPIPMMPPPGTFSNDLTEQLIRAVREHTGIIASAKAPWQSQSRSMKARPTTKASPSTKAAPASWICLMHSVFDVYVNTHRHNIYIYR